MPTDDLTVEPTGTRDQARRAGAAGVAALLVAALLSGCGTWPASAADRPTDVPTSTPSVPPTPTPTSEPEPEPTESVPRQSSAPSPSPTSGPAPETSEPTLLGLGDEGPEVRALQERLIDLGYFLPQADGEFGPATRQAVWALQKAADLSRDGVVGPATQAALDDGARPDPRTASGRAIEVDLDRQLVLAVEDGAVTRVINASSGNGETYEALGRTQRAHTPTGEFTVTREVDATHESNLGLGTMYRPKYFHRGWAVHGSASVPPWPASHGCVRVSNAAMSWIWDVWGAPVGTPVLVFRAG